MFPPKQISSPSVLFYIMFDLFLQNVCRQWSDQTKAPLWRCPPSCLWISVLCVRSVGRTWFPARPLFLWSPKLKLNCCLTALRPSKSRTLWRLKVSLVSLLMGWWWISFNSVCKACQSEENLPLFFFLLFSETVLCGWGKSQIYVVFFSVNAGNNDSKKKREA